MRVFGFGREHESIDGDRQIESSARGSLLPSAHRIEWQDLGRPLRPGKVFAPDDEYVDPAPVAGGAISPDPLKAIDWGTKVGTRTIDVYFAPDGAYLDGVRDFGGAEAWTSFEKAQVRSALAQIETITRLNFRETSSPVGAEFRLGLFDLSKYQIGAFMVPPGRPHAGFMGFDVNLLRHVDSHSGNPMLSAGGFVYAILLEEFGHGLGLAHAHDNGGSSSVLEGVTAPVGSYGLGDLNQGVYTVMNYNEGWPAGPMGRAYFDGTYTYINDFGYEATMMALDVAVLQAKYGANRSHAAGDDTYLLPDANRLGTMFRCIWDTGGTDTIRYDGDRDAVIDLRPATLEGEPGGGGWISYARPIRGGFTIANGVRIEQAIGGDGDDRLTGNGLANLLRGGAGQDRLDGGHGADRMDGGAGKDTFVVDDVGDLTMERANQGVDTVLSVVSHRLRAHVENLKLAGSADIDGMGNAGDNRVLGNASDNLLLGRGGDDRLFGGDGADRLAGGPGADRMVGGRGDDSFLVDDSGDVVVESGPGTDTVRSTVALALGRGVENLLLAGGGAIDGTGNALPNLLRGTSAANALAGSYGSDTLIGNGGDDRLDGGAGADTLRPGTGKDVSVGGSGDDRFVFRFVAEAGLGPARDVIADLEPCDVIDLAAIDACVVGNADQAFTFIGAAAFSGATAELRAEAGLIEGDVNGDGAADFQIELDNLALPTSDNFVL